MQCNPFSLRCEKGFMKDMLNSMYDGASMIVFWFRVMVKSSLEKGEGVCK